MQHSRIAALFVVVLLSLTACQPAQTPLAPAPTAVPTLVPSVAPTTAPTPVPPTPAATLAPPTLAPTPDPLAGVTAIQNAYNKGDMDGLMSLFVEDPNWTLGYGLFGGDATWVTAGIPNAGRNIIEFGFALHTQLTASDCSLKNGLVTCAVMIKDDCKPPAVDAYHIRVQFAFKDGKSSSVFGRWDSTDESAFAAYDAARQEWARQNLPAEAAAYNAFIGWAGGETGRSFGKVVARICQGYTAAGH